MRITTEHRRTSVNLNTMVSILIMVIVLGRAGESTDMINAERYAGPYTA